jgi:hypothetical protein
MVRNVSRMPPSPLFVRQAAPDELGGGDDAGAQRSASVYAAGGSADVHPPKLS